MKAGKKSGSEESGKKGKNEERNQEMKNQERNQEIKAGKNKFVLDVIRSSLGRALTFPS